MSDKNNKTQETNTQNYYELKTDAVHRLVNADSVSKAKVTEDPGKEFRSKGLLDRIPSWVKALFIKFWFNGAVCFFVFWGLGFMIPNIIDMLFVFGVILGIVTDVLVNNTFRFLEVYPGQNTTWMMFPQKKYWTFLANIAYATLILYCVIGVYNQINEAILAGGEEQILGVEPLLFGFLYMSTDMFFISIKNMMVSIVQDAMEKNKK